MTEGDELLTEQKRIEPLFLRQRARSLQLRAESIMLRKERLQKLRLWIKQNRSRIHDAAFSDFRKPAAEVDAIEIFHVLSEIKLALKSLDQWTAPKKVDAPLTMLGTRSSIHYEPKGVCLIIAPWNYPFALAAGPLVSALAAGNTVILKPSEVTVHVSRLISEMVGELYPPDEVAVVEGGIDASQALLRLPFDHIFFTGSPEVGKIVMKAAAENLTSVTLELGGKSPCVVGAGVNIDEAAERIVVAKFVNNGQTCIAPDYILAHESVQAELINALSEKLLKHFGGKTGKIAASADYCRIVNDRHHKRLVGVLQDAIDRGATVHTSGETSTDQNYFHPIIVSKVPEEARVLQEEIFGPILPVVSYTTAEAVIDFINRRPKPLALYLFIRNKKVIKKVLAETSSGGVCIRDCAIHFLHEGLPFGGVNTSGMGKAHGYHGFLAFSHEKPVLIQKRGITSVKLFYPPYTARTRRLMDWFLKLF